MWPPPQDPVLCGLSLHGLVLQDLFLIGQAKDTANTSVGDASPDYTQKKILNNLYNFY